MSDEATEILKQNKSKKIKYEIPSEHDKEAIKNLVRLIKRYDEEGLSSIDKVYLLGIGRDSAVNNVKIIMEIREKLDALNMDVTSFSGDKYLNVACFHPKTVGSAQIGFFWRFGKVKTAENDDAEVGPFVISDLHRGTDDASGAALREFNALQAKVYLFNTMHPHSSDLPARFQPNRSISDGAHSPDTLANPFLETVLNELYPSFALNVVHGLSEFNIRTGEKRFMEMWVINGVRRSFNLNYKNWGALLTLALAQDDFSFGTISVSGKFPEYYIIDNLGVKRNLVAEQGYDGESVFAYISGPNTDTQIHVVNVNDNDKFYDSGRAVHIEHGLMYRDNEPSLENADKQAHLIRAHERAGRWFALWDDRVHTFTDMPKNVRDFDQWFYDKLLTLNVENIPTLSKPVIFSNKFSEFSSGDDDESESEYMVADLNDAKKLRMDQ